MIFLLLCVAVAVYASRQGWVQRLDERVLGPAGLAVALWVWTVLLLAATAGSILRHVWIVTALFGLMSCWVGLGAYSRSRRSGTG